MEEFVSKNGINVCIKKNKNTPRVAFTLNVAINKPEKFAGEYNLLNRLLLKGTTTYSSEELANILEENAIDLFTEMKSDYLRFRFVCLNEDVELAFSILKDIILNTTFDEFEKEKIKLKGELIADLDSAKVKVSDLFTKNIYKNHYYGNSFTKILEEIDSVKKSDVTESYSSIINNGAKTVTVVGDIEAKNLVEDFLVDINNSCIKNTEILEPNKINNEKVEIIQDDANQAQIIQGWIVPTLGSKDYPVLMLMNVILGASGLSSRLFRELREKKGLAYTVRTSYETHLKSAVFSIYIGTEPSNIQTSIDGFKEEIEKIKTIPVDADELRNAKNNLIGKQQFLCETNSQQANLMAHYSIMGKPFNYGEILIAEVKSVTPEDILNCAQKYFTDDCIIAVLHP